MKIPPTLVGIEPTTFRFVAQHLNHCAMQTVIPLIPHTNAEDTETLRRPLPLLQTAKYVPAYFLLHKSQEIPPAFYGNPMFITASRILATCPYPEPDQYSPCPIQLPVDPF